MNLLALAATLVWREPIQRVLRERVMRPIGASPTWRWHGYENSWISLDGINVQIPSGGGHWGGGMFISAYDQARFGLLTSRRYRWGDEQLLPVEWWKMATTPTGANPGYGFMNFYLNTGRRGVASAPESAWIHLGSGVNMIYCDPEHDLVIVARWIDDSVMFEFVSMVLKALDQPGVAPRGLAPTQRTPETGTVSAASRRLDQDTPQVSTAGLGKLVSGMHPPRTFLVPVGVLFS